MGFIFIFLLAFWNEVLLLSEFSHLSEIRVGGSEVLLAPLLEHVGAHVDGLAGQGDLHGVVRPADRSCVIGERFIP